MASAVSVTLPGVGHSAERRLLGASVHETSCLDCTPYTRPLRHSWSPQGSTESSYVEGHGSPVWEGMIPASSLIPISSSCQNCSSHSSGASGIVRYNGLRPSPIPTGLDWLRDQAFMGLEYTFRLQSSKCFQEDVLTSGKTAAPLWFSSIGQLTAKEAPPTGLPTLESIQVAEDIMREPKLPPLRTETEILLAHYIPCYVMLPLDAVTKDNTVSHPELLMCNLRALRAAGVDGVMADVWWGVVEQAGPKMYNWSGYRSLFKYIQSAGLKLQVVMSFHQCGGNTGDSCYIPLPPWVLKVGEQNPEIYFTNRDNMRNQEYLSFGIDDEPVLEGRTAVQVYYDFMRSFRENFADLLESGMITEVEVGMGPAGELRYPSYPETHGWRFPGIGEFQCYDKHLLGQLREAANVLGQYDWGYSGPHDAGRYNDWPQSTGFFCNHGSFNTEYGRFFLEWYSNVLLKHGDRILEAATNAFEGCQTKLAAKVAGVHWWYNSRNHAAELAAGYYNLRERDGYRPIAKMLARHDAMLNFTCIEMRNNEQYWEARCGPEALVEQVLNAGWAESLEVACENALPRYDAGAFDQIILSARPEGLTKTRPKRRISSFTFLRLCPDLLQERNWAEFSRFVRRMHAGLDYHPEPEAYFRPRGRVRRSKPAQVIPDMPAVLLSPSPPSFSSHPAVYPGPEPFFTQDAPGGGLGVQVGEIPVPSSPSKRGGPLGRGAAESADTSASSRSESGAFNLLKLFPQSNSRSDQDQGRPGQDGGSLESGSGRAEEAGVKSSPGNREGEGEGEDSDGGDAGGSRGESRGGETEEDSGRMEERREEAGQQREAGGGDSASASMDSSSAEVAQSTEGGPDMAFEFREGGEGKEGVRGGTEWSFSGGTAEGPGRPADSGSGGERGEEERYGKMGQLLLVMAAAMAGATMGFVMLLLKPDAMSRPASLDRTLQDSSISLPQCPQAPSSASSSSSSSSSPSSALDYGRGAGPRPPLL